MIFHGLQLHQCATQIVLAEGMQRVLDQGLAVLIERFRKISLLKVYVAKIIQGLDVAGLKGDRSFAGGFRLFKPAEPVVDCSDVVIRLGKIVV